MCQRPHTATCSWVAVMRLRVVPRREAQRRRRGVRFAGRGLCELPGLAPKSVRSCERLEQRPVFIHYVLSCRQGRELNQTTPAQ